jgi:hypothetical protein
MRVNDVAGKIWVTLVRGDSAGPAPGAGLPARAGGSGAHYRGFRCPLYGIQVHIINGSGSHYRGIRSP